MPEYKLIYFNLMGRAEAARIIFNQAGVPYEDYRIKREDWPALKPKVAFGQLPVLEVDGKQLCQSQAINRYLGREFGLAGKDEWESAQCDMLVDGMTDLYQHFRPWFAEQDPDKKKALWEALEQNQIKPFLARYDKFLADNGSGFFVGDGIASEGVAVGSVYTCGYSDTATRIHRAHRYAFTGDLRTAELTWADIVLYTSFDYWGGRHPHLLADFKNIRELVSRVSAQPKIKEWLDKRPKTDM